MTNKEKIIVFYYEKKLNTIAISKNLKVSEQYVSKIIKTDDRYYDEKNRRKQENKIKQKQRNINCIKTKRKINKEENDRLNSFVEGQHIQASGELSGKRTINNIAFKKWNTSIYEYHNSTKEFRLKEEFKNKVSYAVPKKIKWN